MDGLSEIHKELDKEIERILRKENVQIHKVSFREQIENNGFYLPATLSPSGKPIKKYYSTNDCKKRD